jgi:hypothetical protein
MLQKDYDRKVQLQKKKSVVVSLKGLAPRRTDWRKIAIRKVTLNLALSANIKLTLHKALMRSVMTYA